MLCDSHCHLSFKDLGEYDSITSKYIQEAQENNVAFLLDVILNPEIVEEAIDFSSGYSNIFNAFAIHPCYVDNPNVTDFNPEQLKKIITSSSKFKAIGETGLDYHLENTNKIKQAYFFEYHCEAAISLGLPIIIHTRNAHEDTVSILKKYVSRGLKGVIHCFTEDKPAVERYLDLDFFISFSGILTFKNAIAIKEAATIVPLTKLLIETDSPYLAPVPFRGKSNQPAYVKYVAEYLAMLKNTDFDIIAVNTTNNFKQLFKIAS